MMPSTRSTRLSCALDMAKAFDSFLSNMGVHDQGLNIGIGLHTGRAVVGLFGTEARREYTAIGAVVNLASRIEQLTKVTNRRVLVSRETMEMCSEAFVFEHVGSFSVKGVERQVDVYEPHPKRVENRVASPVALQAHAPFQCAIVPFFKGT